MNTERLTTLAAFIRSQANLTDKHPHKPGPGEVKLNHAEALEVAEGLEAAVRLAPSPVCAEPGCVDGVQSIEHGGFDDDGVPHYRTQTRRCPRCQPAADAKVCELCDSGRASECKSCGWSPIPNVRTVTVQPKPEPGAEVRK